MTDLLRKDAKQRVDNIGAQLFQVQILLDSHQTAETLELVCDLRAQLNNLFFELLADHLTEQMEAGCCEFDPDHQSELTQQLRAVITSFLGQSERAI